MFPHVHICLRDTGVTVTCTASPVALAVRAFENPPTPKRTRKKEMKAVNKHAVYPFSCSFCCHNKEFCHIWSHDMQEFKKHGQAAVINAGAQDGLKIPKKQGGLHTDWAPTVNWNTILRIYKCIRRECAVILELEPCTLVLNPFKDLLAALQGPWSHLSFLSRDFKKKAGYNQTDTQEKTCTSGSINIMPLPISHFFNLGPEGRLPWFRTRVV